MKELLDRSK